MNHDQLEVLEEELENAIGRVVRRLAKARQIGPPPSGRTYHLMAKAAATVLEAVNDEDDDDKPQAPCPPNSGGYALLWNGTHGVGHWARVLENGIRLAKETKANIEVVQFFAIFHDSCRVNECTDPDHGERGGNLALAFRDEWFVLSDGEWDLLYEACAGHTDGETEADITIQTCWDADRLDLGRVGIILPHKLCTPAPRRGK